MFYSKSTNGFYHPDIHETIPSDAVEISEERHAELLDGQSNGKIIQGDKDGAPILVDPAPFTDEQIAAAVASARFAAYQKEADPIFFKTQRGEATQEEWTAKLAEIKDRYPSGVMPTA